MKDVKAFRKEFIKHIVSLLQKSKCDNFIKFNVILSRIQHYQFDYNFDNRIT